VLLADPDHSASIVLLGPRRCGKTSLLKMLPALLPDAQCVFFDLQDNPVDSAAGFFAALARQAREQARRDRQWELPPLPEGSAFEAGAAWFQALEEAAGDRRILISIDEFTIQAAPRDAREALECIARGQSPQLDGNVRRWLDRRCLITGEGRLRIPILGTWIHHEVLA